MDNCIQKIEISSAELVLINELKKNYDLKKKEAIEMIYKSMIESVKYLKK